MAEREEGAGELEGLEAVEEVALVFVGIQAFEQIMFAAAHFFAGVVAGGDGFGALLDGVIQKAFEFDFGVAQHVGVGGAAGLVFLQEVGEYFVFVLGGEIDDVDVDADDVGHGDGVERILLDAAVFVVVVVFPVLHKNAAHMVPLLFQELRGNGRINAAGKADDDVLRGGTHGVSGENQAADFTRFRLFFGFQAAFKGSLKRCGQGIFALRLLRIAAADEFFAGNFFARCVADRPEAVIAADGDVLVGRLAVARQIGFAGGDVAAERYACVCLLAGNAAGECFVGLFEPLCQRRIAGDIDGRQNAFAANGKFADLQHIAAGGLDKADRLVKGVTRKSAAISAGAAHNARMLPFCRQIHAPKLRLKRSVAALQHGFDFVGANACVAGGGMCGQQRND